MKKITALLGLVLVLFLVACGDNANEASETERSVNSQTEVSQAESAEEETPSVVEESTDIKDEDDDSEEPAPTAEVDMHGKTFADPYSIDEMAIYEDEDGRVFTYKIDNVYEGDEALAFVEQDASFEEAVLPFHDYDNAEPSYLLVEYTETFDEDKTGGELGPQDSLGIGYVEVHQNNSF